MFTSSALQQKLNRMPAWFISVFAAVCSFSVYFCMYAFRKPFTSAGFDGISFLKIDYKVWLVTAQVIGYMLSKFYGIRFISSMQGEKRAITIVKLILASWVALFFFCHHPGTLQYYFFIGEWISIGYGMGTGI